VDRDLVLDTWAGLDFKSRQVPVNSTTIASWVGDQRRRLNAYVILTSYLENVSRFFLDLAPADEDIRKDRRELGDAQVIVDTILSAILGNDVSVTCPSNDALERWATQRAKTWHLTRKVYQLEEKAIGLGDGVLVMWTDGVKKRVYMRTFDPGSYFPILDGSSNEEFPDRVHIAWEFERSDDSGHPVSYIRRMTWDLVERDGATTCLYSDAEWSLLEVEPAQDYDTLPLQKARWYTNASGNELREVDLKIDFIPIVHLPNTLRDDDEHFGKSSLTTVLQVLDEIQATDSDLAKGAAIAGFPPLAADGALAAIEDTDGKRVETYGPGTVFGGSLSTIDTSKSLDALIKYLDKLLARLAVNSHLPESVIGRVRPSEVPSGLAFALGFAPLTAMIFRMRLVREEKYPLIFKFAHRLEQAIGVEGLPAEPGEDEEWPTLKPGAFLPSDLEYTIKNVTNLLQSRPRGVSLETAVAMLVEAGLPIENAADEVRRIRETDFEGAETITSATGDEREAFRYLGMPIPDDLPSQEDEPAQDPEDDVRRRARPGPLPDPVAPELT
jgi:hypothetical protein